MEDILAAFERRPDGSWCCIRDVTLQGPGGRLQVTEGAVFRRGIVFMGIDMVLFLEAHSSSGSSARD